MSLKSKRNRQKRKRERKQKYLKNLKRRSDVEFLDSEDLAVGPGGHEKMSEVLIEFVAPLAHLTNTEEEYRRLMTIAVCAWNACLLPEKEQRDLIVQVLQEGDPKNDQETKAGLVGILTMLMARKRESFSDNRRFIVDFKVMETETGYHLSVISSLEPPPT